MLLNTDAKLTFKKHISRTLNKVGIGIRMLLTYLLKVALQSGVDLGLNQQASPASSIFS